MQNKFKVGQDVTYCGFAFWVIEICADKLEGMIVIRSQRGTTCVAAREVEAA